MSITPILFCLTVFLLILFLTSFLSVKIYGRLAARFGFVDKSTSTGKDKKTGIPIGGGIVVTALFVIATFVLALLIHPFGRDWVVVYYVDVLAACFAWLGFLEDRKKLSNKMRIVVQVIPVAAFAMVLFSPLAEPVQLLFARMGQEPFLLTLGNLIGILFVVFWILSIVNSFTELDRTDGFATMFALLFLMTLTAILWMWNEHSYYGLLIFISLITFLLALFTLVGPPARIYLGKSGSLSIGALLAGLSLYAFSFENYIRPLPIFCLATLPAIESTFAIIRNRSLGRGFFSAKEENPRYSFQAKLGKGMLPIFLLIVLQLPLCAATVAGYWYGSDLIPFVAAALYWLVLPTSGLIGRREIRFIKNRVSSCFNRYFSREQYDAAGLFIDAQFDVERAANWRKILASAQEKGCVTLRVNANYPVKNVDWFGEWKAAPDRRVNSFELADEVSVNSISIGTIVATFDPNVVAPEAAFETVTALRDQCATELVGEVVEPEVEVVEQSEMETESEDPQIVEITNDQTLDSESSK